LLALVVWFAGCLLGLLIVVDRDLPLTGYGMTIEGVEGQVRGQSMNLRVGYLPAGGRQEYRLRIQPEADEDRLGVVAGEAHVSARLESGTAEDDLVKGTPKTLIVVVESPANDAMQTSVVRLTVKKGHKVADLVLQVTYQALPPTVAVEPGAVTASSGRGQDFSSIASVCAAAPEPGDYRIQPGTVRTWLTGDRQCNAYSTCTQVIEPSNKRACLNFTLQGHNECVGAFSTCDAVRSSAGHVAATFVLTRSRPVLVACTT
jgi:hypothetical protein